MKKILISAVLFGSMQSTFAMAADAYLCIPEKATGFAFNKANKQWDEAIFKLGNEKYLLKKVDTKWMWSEFGTPEQPLLDTCEDPSYNGYINCHPFLADISFLKSTLRFQIIAPAGYLNGSLISKYNPEEGSNTPSITIGTCSPL